MSLKEVNETKFHVDHGAERGELLISLSRQFRMAFSGTPDCSASLKTLCRPESTSSLLAISTHSLWVWQEVYHACARIECQRIPTFLRQLRKMKGPGAVFSALLFVATFVLFPYVGMLLRITCSHSPTTDLLFHDLRQRVPTSAQSDYLDTGEKELLSLYMCFNKERHLVLFYTTECEY